jgi:hypothetical protein
MAFVPCDHETPISKAEPEDKRGLAFGLLGTSLGILSLPVPWIGAHLWECFGPQSPFWITVAACMISIPIAWLKFILPEGEGEQGQTQTSRAATCWAATWGCPYGRGRGLGHGGVLLGFGGIAEGVLYCPSFPWALSA